MNSEQESFQKDESNFELASESFISSTPANIVKKNHIIQSFQSFRSPDIFDENSQKFKQKENEELPSPIAISPKVKHNFNVSENSYYSQYEIPDSLIVTQSDIKISDENKNETETYSDLDSMLIHEVNESNLNDFNFEDLLSSSTDTIVPVDNTSLDYVSTISFLNVKENKKEDTFDSYRAFTMAKISENNFKVSEHGKNVLIDNPVKLTEMEACSSLEKREVVASETEMESKTAEHRSIDDVISRPSQFQNTKIVDILKDPWMVSIGNTINEKEVHLENLHGTKEKNLCMKNILNFHEENKEDIMSNNIKTTKENLEKSLEYINVKDTKAKSNESVNLLTAFDISRQKNLTEENNRNHLSSFNNEFSNLQGDIESINALPVTNMQETIIKENELIGLSTLQTIFEENATEKNIFFSSKEQVKNMPNDFKSGKESSMVELQHTSENCIDDNPTFSNNYEKRSSIPESLVESLMDFKLTEAQETNVVNVNTNLTCCKDCGLPINNLEIEKQRRVFLQPAVIQDVNVLMDLFTVDTNVSKNVISALDSKFLNSGASQADIMKHLRESVNYKTLSQLKENMKIFLDAAKKAEIIEIRNKKYHLKIDRRRPEEINSVPRCQAAKRKRDVQNESEDNQGRHIKYGKVGYADNKLSMKASTLPAKVRNSRDNYKTQLAKSNSMSKKQNKAQRKCSPQEEKIQVKNATIQRKKVNNKSVNIETKKRKPEKNKNGRIAFKKIDTLKKENNKAQIKNQVKKANPKKKESKSNLKTTKTDSVKAKIVKNTKKKSNTKIVNVDKLKKALTKKSKIAPKRSVYQMKLRSNSRKTIH